MKVAWAPPEILKEDVNAGIRILRSGWLTQGRETETFEEELAGYLGCKYVIVVNSGTSALITALLAHNIGKDDEVLVPTLSFIASINAILAVGATPILVDSDPATFNTTVEFMKQKLTKKTKAVLPVDVAGMPIDIKAFRDFTYRNNLALIEDAAEAMGASYDGKKIGSFGHTTIFSFHMAKPMTTIEGGCVATNDPEIAKRCKMIRNHGMKGRYDYGCFGLNLRITDIQSAIGRVQLQRLNSFLKKRNQIAQRYMEGLAGYVEFQKIPTYVTIHPWMFFSILVDFQQRDLINEKLNKKGIDTRICWLPVHKQFYHSQLFPGESYPGAEEVASRIINLPMGNGLSDEEVDYVVMVLKDILKEVA